MRDKDEADVSPFCRYGVSDSVIIFDNVFVPKDRIFMCGEWDFGRRMALLFADSHRHSYCGCKPAVSDILCGATILAAEANNVKRASHVKEKLAEFASTAAWPIRPVSPRPCSVKKLQAGSFSPSIYANVGRRFPGNSFITSTTS